MQGVTITDGTTTLDTFVIIGAPELLDVDSMATFSTPVSCFGDSDGEAYVEAFGGTPPYSYMWSQPLTNGPTITNVPADNYTVSITDSNGCVSLFPIEITGPDPLVVDLDNVVNPSSMSTDDGLIQVSWMGGNSGMATYTWNPNVSTSNIAENLPTGTYAVTVTDNKGCTDSISTTLIATTSIKENDVISTWQVFPNPSTGKFNLDVELKQPQVCRVELFNLVGQSVYQIEKTGSSFNLEIDLKDSAAGLYFLKMEVNEKAYLKKVILE